MADSKISIGVKLVTDLKDFITGFRKAQETTTQFGDNVEKKATQPLNKLEAQLRSLYSAQKRSINPEQYQQIGKEIEALKNQIGLFKGKATEIPGTIGGIVGMAKELLPAFGFGAIAAGAVYAFGQMTKATDELGTQWEIFTGGLSSGLDQFWRTMATGDWSTFLTDMREAIKVGREYAAVMDDLEEKQRALTIIEAEADTKRIALKKTMQNVNNTLKDRIKAGQDLKQLEKDLQADKVAMAEEKYRIEMAKTMQQTKLSEEEAKQAMRDFNSMEKQQAKAALETIARYNELQQSVEGFRQAQGRGVTMKNPFEEQLADVKKQVDALPPSIVKYANSYKGLGKTTDEQLNITTEAWAALIHAQNYAEESTVKVDRQVNSLLKGENEYGIKIADKANSVASQIAEYNKQLETSTNLTIEERQAIGAKITALETLKKAYQNIASDPASFRTDKLSAMQTGRVTGALQVSAPSQNKTTDVYAANYSKNKGQLKDIGAYLEQNKDKVKSLTAAWEEWNSRPSNLEILAGQFDSLGYSIGGAFGQFITSISQILNLIPVLIAQISALTVAQTTSSTSVIAAKEGEAIASGTAASQSVPFPFNIIALAVTLASIVAAFAKMPAFATGGIVPGTSFSGDNILARVNSGEEILTRNDPRHTLNQGSAGGYATQIAISNEARIKGEQIYILNKVAETRIRRRT